MAGTTLPGRDAVAVIETTVSANDEMLGALRQASQFLDARACFCSVLDECWTTKFDTERPRHVANCRLPEGVVQW